MIGIANPSLDRITATHNVETRVDIQALRGLAILLVLLHHAQLFDGIKSGYLGVDIFFVVSGYLITRIIHRAITNREFSLSQFYTRRAKRLLPAAYATLVGTTILAPYFLTSSQLRDFAWQLIGAVTFTGNIALWLQTGYFDQAAHLKPLLHVWSLAIEEQYYLLLPLCLMFSPRRFWISLALLSVVASLSICFARNEIQPAATFYLLPTRAWELGLGSFGALIPNQLSSNRFIRIGFWPALLLVALIPVFSTGTQHPGLDALLVCLSTLLIIARSYPTTGNSLPILSLSKLGDISYSLYLVHWPLLAFANNASVAPIPFSKRLLVVLLALILAYILYRFLENPLRRKQFTFTWKSMILTLMVSLSIGASGFLLAAYASPIKNGVVHDFRRPNYGFDQACEYGPLFEPRVQCQNTNSPRLLVWGDSIAMHLVDGIAASYDGGVMQATRSNCGPVIGLSMYRSGGTYNRNWAEGCIGFNESVIEYLSKNGSIKVVVLASMFEYYITGNRQLVKLPDVGDSVAKYSDRDSGEEFVVKSVHETIRTLRGMGLRVVIVSPPPESVMDTGRCLELRAEGKIVWGADYKNCDISEDAAMRRQKRVLSLLDNIATTSNVEIIRLHDSLCSKGVCMAEINQTPLYRDSVHFTVEGSRTLGATMKLGDLISKRAR